MNVWQEILSYLKTRVNTQSYQTWLRPTRLSHVSSDRIFVRVPNRESQDWIQENYGVLINNALTEMKLGYQCVTYVFDEMGEKRNEGGSEKKAVQGKLDFESTAHQLDPRYTFDTFVVGSCNQFAHAAARAVAQAPS